MKVSYLVFDFVAWYYTRAFRNILAVWMNIEWFLIHFFSIPLLLKTFFSPWKRITDQYRRTGIEELLQTLLINVMSRIFGALIRFVIILCGLVFMCFGVVGLFLVVFAWICMPVIFLLSMVYGVMIFFI